jgi:hypothetical protein
MAPEKKESLIKNELTDLGYMTDQQKRGLVKWINGILAVLLFMSVAGNIYQHKEQANREDKYLQKIEQLGEEKDKLNDKYNAVFMQMLGVQKQTDKKADTSKIIVEDLKDLHKNLSKTNKQ